MMNSRRVDKLLKDLNELETEELVEVRNLIMNVIGIRRSLSVLAGRTERPGRRGRRWKDTKKEGKKDVKDSKTTKRS